MIYPVSSSYPVTQHFGDNPGVYNYPCMPDKSHNGIDFGCPEGTPVRAAESGVVIYATMDATGYGNCVKISNLINDGGCIYAHLGKIIVHKGEWMSAGATIGYSGSTGHSTGPHLHFEVRMDIDNCKTAVDPLPLLAQVPVPDPITQPPAPTIPDLPQVTVLADVLNIRSKPGVVNPVVGRLVKGSNPAVMRVQQIDNNTWVQIGWLQWCAMRYQGNQYMDWL